MLVKISTLASPSLSPRDLKAVPRGPGYGYGEILPQIIRLIPDIERLHLL